MVFALASASCGKAGKKSSAQPSPSETPISREIYTGEASLVRRSIDAKKGTRERAYEVHWKTADITLDEKTKNYGGKMEGVTGTIYQKDEPVATFSSDSGEADKAVTNHLSLSGHVKFVGVKRPGVMTCDYAEWASDSRIVKAHGSVKVTDLRGVVGPVDELWCSPDLNECGTPDLFAKR